MKVKYHMWLFALFFSLSTLALPMAAQACGCCGGGSGGVIYNSDDCRFYSVPGTAGHNVVYRAVDDKYYPVARYGDCCHRWKHHKHHHKYYTYSCLHHYISVVCETRPTHWYAGHWYPESRVCFYK